MKETGLLFKGISAGHRNRLNAINQKIFIQEPQIRFHLRFLPPHFLYIISCLDIQSQVFPPASKERFSKLKSPIRINILLPFSIALFEPVPSRAPSTIEAFITESISVGKGTHLLYEKLKTAE